MIIVVLLLLVALLVSAMLGPAAVLGVIAISVVAIIIVQSRRNYFESMPSKDRRFQLRRGGSLFIKNYGIKVKFSGLSGKGISIDAHDSRSIELTVEHGDRSKKIHFDADNMRATKIQEAFGVKFNLLDFRNGAAIFSVDKK